MDWGGGFLIIVSASGPGWPRFAILRHLGASEKFVGGWWVVDFLIIVSAPGPGLPRFDQCKSKGHLRPGQGQGQGQGAWQQNEYMVV